ncbi:ribose-5-phosphate isomerase RpiA [Oceanicella actignis]|uniref:Ribose-5-phosphate isomerase A n=1 Tax=Oceanicella actignis TaxID=1189325 RepID=A0A1M7SBJ9_9RHOB|nr:ribose-5-phosphate isomerase RpiA [Oceanicella actignis]SET26824.1 ribose-5-phosphate isomerase [Oceanicella actignis]SHN55917.1 ribose-5-phosphate isomerase [Oceanicella actignis]
MAKTLTAADIAKRAAAREAVKLVESGMRLGLGTGSTAAWFVELLGERIREEGLKVTGTPTSERTARLAARLGVPLVTLDEAGWLDLTVDGADEFDAALTLIKGGGGALLQEKIVAVASDRMVVIADETKQVETLGAFPLPVEIVPFGWETTKAIVEEMLEDMDVDGRSSTLRMAKDAPYVTDCGHYILDLHLRRIGDPEDLSGALNAIPGVVENGLFIEIADMAVVGHEDDTATTIEAPDLTEDDEH